MKKLILPLLLITLSLFLASCTGKKNNIKEIKLDKILADETLNKNLYSEVCLNIYEKSEKFNKPHYQHYKTTCYYINVYEFTDKEELLDADELKNIIKDTELSIFEERTFNAYRKKDLDYEDDDEYGAPLYTVDPSDLLSLYPVCRINDDDTKYCISSYWEVYDGVSERYAIIKEEE